MMQTNIRDSKRKGVHQRQSHSTCARQHTTQRGSKNFQKEIQKKNQSIKRESYPQGMVKENALERRGISNVQKQGYIGGLNT
jgi:hypothetical protein